MKSDQSLVIERPCLYLVATPIGNLGDITHRALAVLTQVDLICAEDTRTSSRLLDHYAISNAVESLHEKNEDARTAIILKRLQHGPAAVAIISDAGTPLVSDPGYRLVRAAHAAGIPVRSVPGPSAVLAALTLSGLPVDRFVFDGFLPARHAARIQRLKEMANESRTSIFFEAPHRIFATLNDMVEVFGPQRAAFVGRELTKRFETHYRGTLSEIISAFGADSNANRGEFVIVVDARPGPALDTTLAARLLGELIKHLSNRDAVEIVSAVTDTPRNLVYALALERGPR